jgi:hypothetical protein
LFTCCGPFLTWPIISINEKHHERIEHTLFVSSLPISAKWRLTSFHHHYSLDNEFSPKEMRERERLYCQKGWSHGGCVTTHQPANSKNRERIRRQVVVRVVCKIGTKLWFHFAYSISAWHTFAMYL